MEAHLQPRDDIDTAVAGLHCRGSGSYALPKLSAIAAMPAEMQGWLTAVLPAHRAALSIAQSGAGPSVDTAMPHCSGQFPS